MNPAPATSNFSTRGDGDSFETILLAISRGETLIPDKKRLNY